MGLDERIKGLARWGEALKDMKETGEWNDVALKANWYNSWFTASETTYALDRVIEQLDEAALRKWAEAYTPEPATPKHVGIVMAGNIPMVGFHDLLSVLVSGHIANIKLSSQDEVLMKTIAGKLVDTEPGFKEQVNLVEYVKGMDAVIATGSDNSARYFDYYFRDIPHIIRNNRTGVAVLHGDESGEELKALGEDLFRYYGLGCRNLSKIYAPEGYDFKKFFESIEPYASVKDHHKYANNYGYYKAVFYMNYEDFLDNGFLLLARKEDVVSPVSVCYYEYYTDYESLKRHLREQEEKIQCIVSGRALVGKEVAPGKAQRPGLTDYADEVDTMEFLRKL